MLSQPVITCSKLTIETLEQRCEICSKLTVKTPKRLNILVFSLLNILVFALFHFSEKIICNALRDLVPLVQYKKREKYPWRSVTFSKVY